MNDLPIEAFLGRNSTPAGPGPLGALLLVLAMLGMLLVAYVVVSIERKIRRGDFDAAPPQMLRRHRHVGSRGFPVILRHPSPLLRPFDEAGRPFSNGYPP